MVTCVVGVRWKRGEKSAEKKRDVEVIRSFDKTVVCLLVIVIAGLASLTVLLCVGGGLENFRAASVVSQPCDEDGPQRLGSDGDAGVTLEEAAYPLGPATGLHRPVKARLRRMEEIGRLASHLKRKELLVLVQDGSEL